MASNLPRLVPSASDPLLEVQSTSFVLDVLGRYVCSTWDEATQNGGAAFDAVVIGAGMFGAYAAEKLFRGGNLRVLLLDAGSLLVTEHVQNLSRIGLNAAGPKKDANGFDVPVKQDGDDPGTRERVWGIPMRSDVPIAGNAYCLGGRSLYWGGWAPKLTPADLDQWPTDVRKFLDANYEFTERETGVFDKTDYITGPLFDELEKKFKLALPVPSVDEIEDAPLAVQAAAPASGLFSFDKWSSAPIVTDAIREASNDPDWKRRLFYVPRAHVTRLQTSGGAISGIELRVDGQPRFLAVHDRCAVVVASGTVEATRLAMDSFPTAVMGRNLMAHLRSNLAVRIKRTALSAALTGLPRLEAAALLVRGSTTAGRYHLQVTAAATAGPNPEVFMWRMIPDLDLLNTTLANEDSDWISITLRGIGEMVGDRTSATRNNGSAPSFIDLSDQTDEFGARRAWVNLATSKADGQLWNTMDDASLALALKLANNDPKMIQYFYNVTGSQNEAGASWNSAPPLRSTSADKNDKGNKIRDGLGTTHHEAGTLFMGEDATKSVTDLFGRFHHLKNGWVAGPALFPTLGSANPSLTALTLARRTAQKILARTINPDDGATAPNDGFVALGTGGLARTKMAGSGQFVELGAGIIESSGGPGLLWFSDTEYENFVLRADFRMSSGTDNSGIFIRIPALTSTGADADWLPANTDGYEIQIDNTGKNPTTGQTGDALHATGAIYALAKSTGAMPSVGAWHSLEVTANGPVIFVKIDGVEVSRLSSMPRPARRAKGFIGVQNHHPGSRVQFARLRIKKL